MLNPFLLLVKKTNKFRIKSEMKNGYEVYYPQQRVQFLIFKFWMNILDVPKTYNDFPAYMRTKELANQFLLWYQGA